MPHKKIIIFGAGKIGRSFIGQLFGRAGYELVFVDVDRSLIDLLNRHRKYRVVFKSDDGDEVFVIQGARGIHLEDADAIVDELADTSLASVSVGQQGLPSLLPVIGRALTARKERHGMVPLDIIIAENMRNAGQTLKEHLRQLLPCAFQLDDMIGLVETSIGKMAPVMTAGDLVQDPLLIIAEPYNTLIVDRHGFKNPIPQIEGLAPKENIKAWVDRKLFIHNLGHSTAAYLGHANMPGATFLTGVLSNEVVYEKTRTTMLESAEILLQLHPDAFTRSGLTEHIDDLLKRFSNKALGDTVFRVGCDLHRKLGPDDRFAAPLQAALRLGIPHNYILEAMSSALLFRAKDQHGRYLPSDEIFFAEAEKGIGHVLQHVSGFTREEVQQLLCKKDTI